MICENCGAKVSKRQSYCPKCGLDLFNSDYKPLKSKYLRGEYREQEEIPSGPYNLDDEDFSEAEYQQKTYQNQNDYHSQDYRDYDPDNEYLDNDKDYHVNPDKKSKRYAEYNDEKEYKKKYNKNKSPQRTQRNYNPEKQHRKKRTRGYDLDEYYGSEETGSSIWGIVILLLIIGLLFGFVMGFMFFSTKV